jgi:hypothetical protein
VDEEVVVHVVSFDLALAFAPKAARAVPLMVALTSACLVAFSALSESFTFKVADSPRRARTRRLNFMVILIKFIINLSKFLTIYTKILTK